MFTLDNKIILDISRSKDDEDGLIADLNFYKSLDSKNGLLKETRYSIYKAKQGLNIHKRVSERNQKEILTQEEIDNYIEELKENRKIYELKRKNGVESFFQEDAEEIINLLQLIKKYHTTEQSKKLKQKK